MTLGEALARASERLRDVSATPRLDAQRLLEFAVGRSVAWIFAHGEEPLAAAQGADFAAALARRERGEPLAYIEGKADFYGRTFVVTPAVLVPRPESEHLIAAAVKYLRPLEHSAVCDVGTGSGSLAVTLALEVPNARIVAIDISPEALEVAAQNARAHGVVERVRFRLGNLFEPLVAAERFDCIIANLPYVATAELAPPPDATSYEPRLALAGGRDGLLLYRRLLARAPAHLAEPGLLLMEAAADTVPMLVALARDAFTAASVTVIADYANCERVVRVRRSG